MYNVHMPRVDFGFKTKIQILTKSQIIGGTKTTICHLLHEFLSQTKGQLQCHHHCNPKTHSGARIRRQTTCHVAFSQNSHRHPKKLVSAQKATS